MVRFVPRGMFFVPHVLFNMVCLVPHGMSCSTCYVLFHMVCLVPHGMYVLFHMVSLFHILCFVSNGMFCSTCYCIVPHYVFCSTWYVLFHMVCFVPHVSCSTWYVLFHMVCPVPFSTFRSTGVFAYYKRFAHYINDIDIVLLKSKVACVMSLNWLCFLYSFTGNTYQVKNLKNSDTTVLFIQVKGYADDLAQNGLASWRMTGGHLAFKWKIPCF